MSSTVDPRHCTTFNEAYLITLWMRRFYARHHGVVSIQDAIAVGKASFKDSVVTAAVESISCEGDDGRLMPSPPTQMNSDDASQRLDVFVPPQQIAALLSSCWTKRRTFSCCSADTCGSVASHSSGFHKFLAARRAAHSSTWSALPTSCVGIHAACELCLHPADAEVRLVPRSVEDRRHAVTRDDVVMCAAQHVAAVASPARLRIQHYRQQPTMSAATSGASYEGLAAMLLAPCSPRWSSVTLYGVANASDADAAGHILGKAILNEDMRGERRGAGATHHDAHEAGGWRRLAVGSWAGTVGMSRLFAALRQTDFIQELILDDCFPANFRLDDLCEYVATRKVLRRLSLRNNAGTVGPSVGPIGRACGNSWSLCSLDLALCGMHDAHVALLFNALAEARHHKMINDDEGSRCADTLHLDLSHNNITLDSLAALALAPPTTGRLCALDEGQQHQPYAKDSCSVCSDVDVRTVLQTLVSLDLSGNPLYKRPPRSNTGGSGGAATTTESPALLLMRLVALCPQLTRLRVNDSGLLPDGGMPAACTAARGSHAGSGDLRRLVKAWLSNVLQQATWWSSTPPLPSSATCLAPTPPLRVPWVGTLAKTTASGDADVIRCDVELALGGCSRMSVADVRAVVVAVSDAARGGSGAEGRERDGRSLRSALTLYAIPAVAAALADSATVAALGHLVVLDLRTCALGNEGAVHLGAALERCAAVSPMLLEMLLLSDNGLGATGNALGGQAPGNASSGSHGRKGTASNNASRKKDGLQFLCKGLRGSVLPRLRHLDVSWNGIATFRPFVALMEQAAPSFCSLNLSGHTALQWNEGSVGPPPPDDDHQGGANLAAVTYARTSFGKAPVVELALAVQSRLIAAAPPSPPSAAASVHRTSSNTVEGGSFVLTLRDCNCDALGRTFGTVGLKIIA